MVGFFLFASACALLHPWPGRGRAGVAVSCGGAPAAQLTWAAVEEGEVFSFSARVGDECTVSAV